MHFLNDIDAQHMIMQLWYAQVSDINDVMQYNLHIVHLSIRLILFQPSYLVSQQLSSISRLLTLSRSQSDLHFRSIFTFASTWLTSQQDKAQWMVLRPWHQHLSMLYVYLICIFYMFIISATSHALCWVQICKHLFVIKKAEWWVAERVC